MKQGLIINEPLMNAAKELNETEFKEFFVNAYYYATNNIVPTFESQGAKMLFSVYKPFIDSNNKKYQEKVQNSKTKLFREINPNKDKES